jgi:hypothetical protein
MARSKTKNTARKTAAKKQSASPKGTSAMNAKKTVKKRPAQADAKSQITTSEPETESVEQPATPRRGRPAAKKKSAATAVASTPQAALALGVSVNKRKQTQARAAAKQSRQKTSGLVRVQANAGARTKRKQAKRDAV